MQTRTHTVTALAPAAFHRKLALVKRLELVRGLHVRALHRLQRVVRLELLLLLPPPQRINSRLASVASRLGLVLLQRRTTPVATRDNGVACGGNARGAVS